MGYKEIIKSLKLKANKEHSNSLQRFFKTGKGEYGEGDIFIGIKVPPLREIAKENVNSSFEDLEKLFNSKIHEERLTAIFILVYKSQKADEIKFESIYNFYISNLKNVNNWDLVDLSAPYIIGKYLLNRNKEILFKLAESENLWEKRIAMISTQFFIKNNIFDYTFKIADKLINDKHDLIHKAVGWMLREIGKKDLKAEEDFLKPRYKKMPRTMLRYAIEKFEETKRKKYLYGNI